MLKLHIILVTSYVVLDGELYGGFVSAKFIF